MADRKIDMRGDRFACLWRHGPHRGLSAPRIRRAGDSRAAHPGLPPGLREWVDRPAPLVSLTSPPAHGWPWPQVVVAAAGLLLLLLTALLSLAFGGDAARDAAAVAPLDTPPPKGGGKLCGPHFPAVSCLFAHNRTFPHFPAPFRLFFACFPSPLTA